MRWLPLPPARTLFPHGEALGRRLRLPMSLDSISLVYFTGLYAALASVRPTVCVDPDLRLAGLRGR